MRLISTTIDLLYNILGDDGLLKDNTILNGTIEEMYTLTGDGEVVLIYA